MVDAVRAARQGQVAVRGVLLGSLLVLFTGAGAFALSRGLAHDAAHPLPLNSNPAVHFIDLEPPTNKTCRSATGEWHRW